MKKFKHKKSLGQNFLKNEEIIDKIINSVNISPQDLIIEIGPGQGVLTKQLKTFNASLICYELDERLKSILNNLEDDKTKIIYQDFLKTDFADINKIAYKKLYVIANIPYYITTPIINKIINASFNLEEMILMVQKEVADRICAKPKSKAYGSLTIYLNYYFEIEKLFLVGKENFIPIPKVDSAVIKLKKRKDKYQVNSEECFFKLINSSFKFKRKNIKNNLFDYNLDLVANILSRNNLSLNSRAEEISIEVFIELANELNKKSL